MALALYIHWPFCVSKCPYCDFNSHVRENIDANRWQEALITDMRYEAGLTSGTPLSSIFFGGGTPSLMPPAIVSALIREAEKLWGFDPNIEITLEANPSSVEAACFADLASAGVNRISLGLQSLDDTALNFLGRAHNSIEGLQALETAKNCFQRVSFDLIYALPGQNLPAWTEQLERALTLGVSHMSLYQLTIEPNTRFATDVRQGHFTPMADKDAAHFYEQTQAIMIKAGLPAYETSNHARPGQESRHNLTYWQYDEYIGIGPGAHGRRLAHATERHKKPENYLSAITRNTHGLKSESHLSPQTQAVEAIMMGLRLTQGVNYDVIASRFGLNSADFLNFSKITALADHHLLNHATGRLAATATGHLLLNAILAEIVNIEPPVIA